MPGNTARSVRTGLPVATSTLAAAARSCFRVCQAAVAFERRQIIKALSQIIKLHFWN